MGIAIYEILNVASIANFTSIIQKSRIVVDAIFGTGLSGPVREPYASVIQEINSWNKVVFAVDIPSGLDANSGEILGIAIRARYTITFVLPKRGFMLKYGPELTGEILIVSISIPKELLGVV